MKYYEMCIKNPNMTIPFILMASFLYYIEDMDPPISDLEFDAICKLAYQNWGRVKHPHKHLISTSHLESGSLFDFTRERYPLMVRNAAYSWLKADKTNPFLL